MCGEMIFGCQFGRRAYRRISVTDIKEKRFPQNPRVRGVKQGHYCNDLSRHSHNRCFGNYVNKLARYWYESQVWRGEIIDVTEVYYYSRVKVSVMYASVIAFVEANNVVEVSYY